MSDIKKETRAVGEFNRIRILGIGEVHIKQGAKQELVVEAEEHLLSKIRTDVIDNRLTIDIGRDWLEKISAGFDYLSSRGIVFHITVKDLESLEIAGASKLDANDLKAKDLRVSMSGASSVEIYNLSTNTFKGEIPGAGKLLVEGKAKEQTVSLTGAGSYVADKFETPKAKVTITGVGTARLWVEKELDAVITGVGTIEYYGEPEIKQSVTMVGTIRSMGKK